MKYYESNLVGNVRLDGVKLLLPLFGALFGAPAALRLRAVADNYTWPLVWSLGDGSQGGEHGGHGPGALRRPPFGANQRFLDPLSAASRRLNATFAPNASAVFSAVWAEVAAARAAGQPSADAMKAWWTQLEPAMVRLGPLTANSCADFDECVGVVPQSGECVCTPAAQ
eukprot:5928351-Prymnesium_polylepis.1